MTKRNVDPAADAVKVPAKKRRGGYVKMPRWLLEREGLKPGPRLLLAVLMAYAARNGGKVYPGTRTLREELAGIGQKTLTNWTAALVKARLVTVVPGGPGQANQYTLHLPDDSDSAPPGSAVPCSPMGAPSAPPGGAPPCSPLDSQGAPLLTQGAPLLTKSAHPGCADVLDEAFTKTVGEVAAAPPTAAATDSQNENEEEEKRKAEDSQMIVANEEVLKVAGIGQPMRGRLARLPGVTIWLIQQAAIGREGGLLVREIEARAEQAVAKAANPNPYFPTPRPGRVDRSGRVEAPPGKYDHLQKAARDKAERERREAEHVDQVIAENPELLEEIEATFKAENPHYVRRCWRRLIAEAIEKRLEANLPFVPAEAVAVAL